MKKKKRYMVKIKCKSGDMTYHGDAGRIKIVKDDDETPLSPKTESFLRRKGIL